MTAYFSIQRKKKTSKTIFNIWWKWFFIFSTRSGNREQKSLVQTLRKIKTGCFFFFFQSELSIFNKWQNKPIQLHLSKKSNGKLAGRGKNISHQIQKRMPPVVTSFSALTQKICYRISENISVKGKDVEKNENPAFFQQVSATNSSAGSFWVVTRDSSFGGTGHAQCHKWRCGLPDHRPTIRQTPT